MKIENREAKVEAYFGAVPPWETTVSVILNGIVVWTKAKQFSADEGAVGYDRALKVLFQALNDDFIITAVQAWYHNKL